MNLLLLDSLELSRVHSECFEDGATCWFETATRTVCGSKLGNERSRAVCRSSSLIPPCSAIFEPPVKITPVLTLRIMPGVRGSSPGPVPGTSHLFARDGPAKISWMPRVCWLSGSLKRQTTLGVRSVFVNQINDPSSEMSNASDAPMSVAVWPLPMGCSFEWSIGDWPCLAQMMIKVESYWPLLFSSATIRPRISSTKSSSEASPAAL